MRLPLSVTVLTLNEERNLGRCLQAVADIASEIVVVDSGSTDRTAEIAAGFGAQFVFNPWSGFNAQRRYGEQYCTQPWVLALDADEEVSPELRAALIAVLGQGESPHAGIAFSRRTFYLGAWIWHVWYPEWRLRLYRRERGRWVGEEPHGYCEVDGSTLRVKGDLLHYSFRNLTEHLSKTLGYARTSAGIAHARGKRFNGWRMIGGALFRVFRDVLLKSGWRDGWRGVLIAMVGGYSSFAKQAFLYEAELAAKDDAKP
ncbi:MAG: glycosyltransferase family 2 protein [Nevskia sp.]|uniref:glycosyltransferase family 2 protein n=1 Tax=Nevskia sp. TaxID=1929292 RepID=UPI004035B2EC